MKKQCFNPYMPFWEYVPDGEPHVFGDRVYVFGSHDMFIAEVVNVTVDDRYMDENNKFNLNDSDLVAYSHGEYFTLGEKIGTFGYSVRKK